MNYRLAQAIYDAGFSIIGFADSIGMHRNTLRNYVYKGRSPNVRNAIRIARGIGTTVEELWGREEHDGVFQEEVQAHR